MRVVLSSSMSPRRFLYYFTACMGAGGPPSAGDPKERRGAAARSMATDYKVSWLKEGPKREQGSRCKGAKQGRGRPQRGATARSEGRITSEESYKLRVKLRGKQEQSSTKTHELAEGLKSIADATEAHKSSTWADPPDTE